MRLNIKAYKLFYTLLASYAVILLVPLIILGGLIYGYFISIIKDELLNNNLMELERTRTIVDNQLHQLNAVSNQLFIHHARTYYFETDPLYSQSIIEELKNYTITNSFISDIILYYRGDDYLYSSTSSYSISLFLSKIYPYETWDYNAFYDYINHLSKPDIRETETIRLEDKGPVRYVTFAYPLSFDGSVPKRTALFLVQERSFQNLLTRSTEYRGNTIILDDKNRVVTASNDAAYLDSDTFSQIAAASGELGNETISLEGMTYFFSYVKSAESGWKYVTLAPESSVLRKVDRLKLMLISVLALLLAFNAALIFYLMKMNYRPIYHLKKLTERLRGEEKPTRVENELETVKNALEFLYERSENHAVAAKEYFLFRLIKGQVPSRERVIEEGRAIGVKLSRSSFRIIIFHVNKQKDETRFPIDPVVELIEQSIPADKLDGYARDHMDQRNIVMIASGDVMPQSELKAIIGEIQAKLNHAFGIIVTVGVGTPYTDVSQLPKSYIEATTAIDYRLVQGTGQIIFFQDITRKPSAPDNYPHQASEQLRLYIKQGNTERIDHVLQSILTYLKNDLPSIFLAKRIAFEIINTVVQTLEEMNQRQVGFKLDYPDVFLLSEFESVDELAAIVKSLGGDIRGTLDRIKNGHNEELIQRMMGYVQNRYADCNFSIQQMADHFKFSQAGLSQYFKEQSGITLLEYETQLKLGKAKKLLSSSKLPLKDIAIEVGYYNVNSFIRRFKQVTGMTPGEYRKQMEP